MPQKEEVRRRRESGRRPEMDVQRDDERTLITKAHRVGPRGTAIHALARCAN